MLMSTININNYLFDQPLKCDNSGFSKWGIGLRGKNRFFVKEFLSPVFPADTSIYSERKRKALISICSSFVNTKTELDSAIRTVSDGNLVGIEQFFRVGAKYYISTEAILQTTLSVAEIANYPFYERLKLCCIISHAVERLHSQKIVHADIKPDNVLVYNSPGLHAKIIDFDCSFFEKNAPMPGEELNGDMVYFSPEAFLHIAEEESVLSCKMDIFALGLLFHQYFTGYLPYYDISKYQYAYESVLDDHPLGISREIPYAIASLLIKMLRKNPTNRPDAATVFLTLKQIWDQLIKRETPSEVPSSENRKAEAPEELFFKRAGDL